LNSNVACRYENFLPSSLAPTPVITHPGTSTVSTESKHAPLNAREISKTPHQPSPRRQNFDNLSSEPTVTLIECAALPLIEKQNTKGSKPFSLSHRQIKTNNESLGRRKQSKGH